MVLKWIIISSFAITGSLFYLSRQGASSQIRQAGEPQAAVVEPETADKAPITSHLKRSLKTPENEARPEAPHYAALLPQGQDLAVRKKPQDATAEFYSGVVRQTIRSCFDELVKRRTAIWEAREGDAELSIEGEFTIVATFAEHELVSLRSQSAEIRDDRFHNCIETGAKTWTFPDVISRQKTWNFRHSLNFDVNYNYDCKDGGAALLGGGQLGGRKCF
ncbi:hypothetical protein [Oligoflexus tunisiensis]|uniref:hypothetical protein n=1 Tax=Oligoflexus tunisiensis TaxID=708132 RepID=UPI00114CDC67|nr:hypothetical protein [Oligoflexus tunisiensis]